jgi:acetyl-CoA acetyltransferase family protein
MSAAYIYEAVRTPFGRYGGALSAVRPDDLAAEVLKSLLARVPELAPEQIDDVIYGVANGSGEDNRDVARMAVLLAGLPTSVPGATVNRLCGSSLEASIQAARAIETGDAQIVVAGGVESMSRAPWILPKPSKAFPATNETLYSSALGWRMVNPRMPSQWTISLGESVDRLCEAQGIGRDAQDEFALRSHQLAAKAYADGVFAEVVPVPNVELTQDEGIRPDSSLEKLAKLKPAFVEGGTVTAGNSSPLNDGASAILFGAQESAAPPGRAPLARVVSRVLCVVWGEGGATPPPPPPPPLARVVSRAAHGVDPDVFGIGPVEAANKALRKAGLSWDQIDLVELNEAFAGQSLACLQGWPELDPEKVNQYGGAIAIGHPLGASGARILGRVAHELHKRGGGYGLAAICIGVGQGLAVILEGC